MVSYSHGGNAFRKREKQMGKSWEISFADIGKDGWLTPPKDEEEVAEEEGEE